MRHTTDAKAIGYAHGSAGREPNVPNAVHTAIEQAYREGYAEGVRDREAQNRIDYMARFGKRRSLEHPADPFSG